MKIKDQFIPLTGFAFILATALVWRTVKDNLSFSEIGIIASVSLILYILLVWLWTWYHMKPRDLLAEHRKGYEELYHKIENGYEQQYQKIKATVDKLIQKQRFIDQGILNVIEREAEKIWVITTKLANELEDIELQNAVKKNLAEGKLYTYFLPHPDDVHFGRIERNLNAFKQLELYEKYKGQIEFIRLPLETQFLLDEVVIYNPEKQYNPHDATRSINGFTYYECKDDPEAEGPLHMKIEGHLLSFLSERLDLILHNTGLKSAAERILTEFADNIDETDELYLVSLLRRRSIKNQDKYTEFIDRISTRPESEEHSKFINQILNKYIEI